jgi:hypothetical protein
MDGRIRTVQEHNIGKKKFVFEKKQTPFQKKITVLLSLFSSFTSGERGYFTMIKQKKLTTKKRQFASQLRREAMCMLFHE